MPLHIDTHPTAQELARYLVYYPGNGRLVWKRNRPPYYIADSEAGTINKHGFRIVSLKGRKYMAHYLAWTLHHGVWPSAPIRLVSAHRRDATIGEQFFGRSDLRLKNLSYDYAMPSTDDVAISRQRARTARQRRKDWHADLERLKGSDYPGIFFDSARNAWVAIDPQVPSHEIGVWPSRNEAENALARWSENMKYLLDHPPPRPLAARDALTAGWRADSWTTIQTEICYAPDLGRFIWRIRPHIVKNNPHHFDTRAGYDAVELNTGGNPVVHFHGKIYSAAMLAWFLIHEEWPARKSVRFKPVRGKPGKRRPPMDLRLSNMEKIT